MPPNTRKVDRSTPWGNPFIVGKQGSAIQCVYNFVLMACGYHNLSTGTECGKRQDALYERLRAPPAPTAAIKAMLPKLADLPKEAEQELRTAEDLRRELATVRRELTLARKEKPPGASPEELKAAERRGYERGTAETQRAAVARMKEIKGLVHRGIENILETAVFWTPQPPALSKKPLTADEVKRVATPLFDAAARKVASVTKLTDDSRGNGSLPKGEAAILAGGAIARSSSAWPRTWIQSRSPQSIRTRSRSCART